MSIFATRAIARTKSEGVFHCPQCDNREHYKRKNARRFLALFQIPLIPVDAPIDFVECQNCDMAWEPDVLDFDPAKHQAQLRAEWEGAVLTVMVRVMLADGRTHRGEVGALRGVYLRLTEHSLSEGDLLAEIASVEARGGSLREDLEKFIPVLDEHGKEMVFRAALAVAAADGELQEEERLLLAEIADVLQMSHAHVQGIFASAHAAGEMQGEG